MVTYEPIGDNVLVRFEEREESDEYERGTVVAIGPGYQYEGKRQPPDVSVGDVIIFSYEGTVIWIDGIKHAFIDDGTVLSIEKP